MLDADTLRLVWWLLIVVLIAGFVVTDGFDLGALILLPLAGKTDEQRRLILNSVGATWEGNQTWLITAAGATFAAWPLVYAVSFSGLYLAMMLALFALFARPVGFDYRSKLTNPAWRTSWDWALFVGGLVPTLVLGLLMGNLFLGLPFRLDDEFRSTYSGRFVELFHPFALAVALAAVALCTMHGGAYVQGRVERPFAQAIARWTVGAALLLALLFVVSAFWVAGALPGLQFAPSESLLAPTTRPGNWEPGAWSGNFGRQRSLLLLPLLALLATLLTALASRAGHWRSAFAASSLAVLGTIASVGVSLFPVLLASSAHPPSSLTVWNASSSPKTLWIMLLVAAVFVPLIVLYTGWVYRVLRGPITADHLRRNGKKLY